MAKSKPLYHSALKELGRTALRFKSDVREGKFGPYCFVEMKGESEDRLFNVDSDHVRQEIERTRSILKDGWVDVEASGGKGDAMLSVLSPGTEGPVLGGDTPNGGPPPNEWGASTDVVPVEHGGIVAKAVAMTLQAVKGLEAGGVRVDSDAAARIYNTHFIQASRG